jgi:hypothetical protein
VPLCIWEVEWALAALQACLLIRYYNRGRALWRVLICAYSTRCITAVARWISVDAADAATMEFVDLATAALVTGKQLLT